jgi:hypothetical protein
MRTHAQVRRAHSPSTCRSCGGTGPRGPHSRRARGSRLWTQRPPPSPPPDAQAASGRRVATPLALAATTHVRSSRFAPRAGPPGSSRMVLVPAAGHALEEPWLLRGRAWPSLPVAPQQSASQARHVPDLAPAGACVLALAQSEQPEDPHGPRSCRRRGVRATKPHAQLRPARGLGHVLRGGRWRCGRAASPLAVAA